MSVSVTDRCRQPLEKLGRRATAYAGDAAAARDAAIDRSRWFIHPELTPLYYAPIYRELTEAQQRRYNQITAMCCNELIAVFEESFAPILRTAIASLDGRDEQLADCLRQFLADEREHITQWRALNRRTEPTWYARQACCITRLPRWVRQVPAVLGRSSMLLPACVWLMLALEEHALEMSRRCLHLDTNLAEPVYREAYRQHAADEVRHVHMDWHLIERFHGRMPLFWRRINAGIVAAVFGRCFLSPTRSAMRVIRLLITEYPELAPLHPTMRRQLCTLTHHRDYHAMMYSRRATPILFGLFDRFPEMHRMRHVLLSYTPKQPLAA